MGILYIDSNGVEKTRHSYSAGLEFDTAPLKFKLKRILGWREKESKAALLFGRALESAIQFYHEHEGKGAVEEFVRLWVAHRNNDKLKYTAKEVGWDNLNKAGQDMLKIYAIRQPSLPIPMNTRFQREFLKEVFPGDERLGGIEFYGKLDAMPNADPHHPLLVPIQWTEASGLFRPVIVDFKTAGFAPNYKQGDIGHDLQLRSYAWLTGIFDVALATFVKSPATGLKKGSVVTLLEDAPRDLKAGDEAIVAVDNKDENFTVYLLKDDAAMDQLDEAQGRKDNGNLDTTKAAVARKQAWVEQNGILMPQYKLSRQRFQFTAGRVSKASAQDAGDIAADQIVRIVTAWEQNKYPCKFGIRYPLDGRRDPFYKAFVEGDNVFRDSWFEQRNDEFFEEDDEIEIEGETN
jgi:hypothetical protein